MSQGYAASVLFIGDSITEGMAPHLGLAAALVGAKRVAVYSKSGTSAKDWSENGWNVEVAREFRQPNLAVIALGTNVQERDEYEYAGLMRVLADTIQVVNAMEVVLVGPFAEDPEGKRNRALLGAGAGRNVVNGYELARGLPRAGEGDIHFTREGYKGLAERLCARIRPGIVRVNRPGRSILAVGALLGAGFTGAIGGWYIPFVLPFRSR